MSQGWVAFIVIVILICICMSISEAGSNSNAAAEKALKQSAEAQEREERRLADEKHQRLLARRPEALAAILAEEFPQFAGQFTYARSKAMLEWYESKGLESQALAVSRAPGRANVLLGMHLARQCAPMVSREFADHIEAHRSTSWAKFRMCVEGSAARAQGM